MIDAASGNALVNKTPEATKQLIANMAANSQQFGHHRTAPQRVNEVQTSSIGKQLANLTTMLSKLANGNALQTRPCGIHAMIGHPTDMCPTLQSDIVEEANAIGGFPGQPLSNTCNSSWKNHSNLSYGNQQRHNFSQGAMNGPPRYNQQGNQQFQNRQQPAATGNTSVNELIKALVIGQTQLQQGRIQLQQQYTQLAQKTDLQT